MGCAFCASGLPGLIRNLTSGEIAPAAFGTKAAATGRKPQTKKYGFNGYR